MGRSKSNGVGSVAPLAAAVALGLLGSSAARGGIILDFEGGGADGGEGLVNTNYTIGSFGATHGTHADDIVNTGPAATLFDIGTVNGSASGPALAHYNAINAGLTEAGPLQISFDLSIDTRNVTSDGYYQLTLIGNSQNRYFQLGYGDFINGYNILSGLSLGTLATTEGVTLAATTPYAGGIGTYHVTAPLFPQAADADQKHPTFGDGAGGTNSTYFQLSLLQTGGYGGTATLGVDNVQVGGPPVAVPEPACLGLLAAAAPVVLRRRRRASPA